MSSRPAQVGLIVILFSGEISESPFSGKEPGNLQCLLLCRSIDHNTLTSYVSYNLPFFPTTKTLYQLVPCLTLIIDSQSSCIISEGGRRTRSSKCFHYVIMLRRTEEAVQWECLWSESTFICHFNIENCRRGDVNFQCIGKIHIDLDVICLAYCVVINLIFKKLQALHK